ncbi:MULTISPECIES: RDD family protein [Bacillus]|uniref:RDD family protein n=1 Tax=Bacillus TaxID=1386 RepID=UPI00098AE409|nr:RDD family protein [Bacillus sonorensis]
MQYADVWVRAGALVTDCVIAVGLHLSSDLIFGGGSPGVLATAVLVYVFCPLFMPLTKLQGTIGKAVFRLPIVSADSGGRLKLWQAIVRYCAAWVHFISVLFYLAVLFSEKKQADLAAKTYVIKADVLKD